MGVSNVSFFVFAVLLLIVIIPDTYALTRSDLDNIEKTIEDNLIRIDNIDKELITQREIISNDEHVIEDAKDKLRDIKRDSHGTWSDFILIDNQEKLILTNTDTLNDSKDKLSDLLAEKSNLIKENEELTNEFDEQIKFLRVPEKFDPTGYAKLIGIELSQNCKTMILHNIPTSCPDPRLLQQLDSSITELSGEFGDDGWRLKSPVEKSWRYYDIDPQLRIIVDPPQGMADRIKMITIQSNFGVYFIGDDRTFQNNTRTWHEGRYIDNCKNAVIGTDDIGFMLADTIFTLRNNCTHSNYEEIKTEIITPSIIDITTSPNYQYSLWLAESKVNCKELC